MPENLSGPDFQRATLAAMSDDQLLSTYLAWLDHYRRSRGEDRAENLRLLGYAWQEARGRGLEGRVREAVEASRGASGASA